MGHDSQRWPSRLLCAKLPSRNCRLALLVGFTLMLALPLYQLRDQSAAGYYYRRLLYDRLSQYLNTPGIYNNTLYQGGANVVHPVWNFSAPCQNFPNIDNVMLVMKTGASEAFDKVPTQLLTSLQCIDDFLLFSDFEQQIGKYHVYNVLDRVDETIKSQHKEFKLYEAQLQCPISLKECTKDMTGGWDLDKFKFLNMVVRAWEMRPGRQWYVFAEADTYVVWPTLAHWLQKRGNPKDNVYVGSVTMLNGFPFAHGGSGYVVSGKLMQKMVEEIPNLAGKYDEKAGSECCGDLLFARAAEEVGIKIKQAHPLFNGEKPNTLPYGPGHWCEPILTMHHMNSEDVSAVWQYEQTRTKKDFMQIKELYHAFFAPKLVASRNAWDNLSDDVCYVGADDDSQKKASDVAKKRQKKETDKNPIEKRAHKSPVACANVCEAEGLDISEKELAALEDATARAGFIQNVYDKVASPSTKFKKDRKCFQWKYQKGTCCTSRSFKLGKPSVEKDDADKSTSGWFVRGINDWIEARGDECPLDWR